MHDNGLLGYEVMRRVSKDELPPGSSFDHEASRAVLGTLEASYLIPVNLDVLELGIITTAGHYQLLPIASTTRPRWDEVVDLIVPPTQALRQRELLLRAFRALEAILSDADAAELTASVSEWSQRGCCHPCFGLIRHHTIAVWKTMRPKSHTLSETDFDVLHANVAERVWARLQSSTASSR